MKIAILGATGGSGLCLLNQALEAGHEVVAIVRTPAKLSEIKHENLNVVSGNIFSSESLQKCFEGCQAVLSCLGGGSLIHDTTFYSDSAKAIAPAMRAANVKRFIAMSSWYIKVDPNDNPGLYAKLLIRTMIRKILKDMGAMEQYLETECQDLDYTTVRPPRLLDNPSKGKEFIVEIGRQFVDAPYKIPRADVARFMLQCLETQDYNKTLVSIGLKK